MIMRSLRARLLAALGTVGIAAFLTGPGSFADAMGHLPGDPIGVQMALATQAAIAEAMDGQAWAESAGPGCGATSSSCPLPDADPAGDLDGLLTGAWPSLARPCIVIEGGGPDAPSVPGPDTGRNLEHLRWRSAGA